MMLKFASVILLFGSLGLCCGQAPTRLTISIHGNREELYVLDFSKTKSIDPKPLIGFGTGTTYQFLATTNGVIESWEWTIDWGFYRHNSQEMTYSFARTGVYNVLCKAKYGGKKLEAGFNVRVDLATQINPRILSHLLITNNDPVQVNQKTDLLVSLFSTVEESELNVHGSTVQVRMQINGDDSSAPSNVTIAHLECKDYKTDKALFPDEPIYNVYCQKTVQMQFPQKSLYSINATLEHKILHAGIIHTICVKDDLSCPPPGITIQVPDPPKLPVTYHNASMLTFRQDDHIHLFATVLRDSCLDQNSEGKFEFAWHLIRASEVRRWVGTMTAQMLQEVRKVDLAIRGNIEIDKVADFYVPAHQLELGSYLVVFAATESPYCGSSPVFSHDFVRIDVLPPLLTAVINGGSYREWKPTSVDEDLELDGSQTFLDNEHLTEDVYIAWICRLPAHRNIIAEITNWNDILNLKLQTTGGCFGEGFILKTKDHTDPLSSNKIVIRGKSFTKDYERFVFSLIVFRKSTKEISTYDQEMVRSFAVGISVQVSISCVSNCRKTLVKGDPLRLEATCKGCGKISTSEPQWNLVGPSPKETSTEIHTAVVKSNTSIVTIPADKIQKVGEYVVEVNILELIWPKAKTLTTGRYKFHVAAGPSTGLCEISPINGVALVTKFDINCHNFLDFNPPTTFAVLASPESRHSDKPKDVMLYQGMAKLIHDVYLPPGNENFGYRVKVKITATNQIGRTSTVSYHVTVAPPTNAQISSGVDTLVQGSDSTLSHLMKAGNVDGAVGIMFSVLETLHSSSNKETDTEGITTVILGQLTSQAPKTAKNAFQFASALALATNPKFQTNNADNKRTVSNSVQEIVTTILNTEQLKTESLVTNQYVEPALTSAIEAVGNAVTLPSLTLDSKLQTNLLETKENVLKEISSLLNKDKVLSIGDKEHITFVKSQKSSEVRVKFKDTGVAINNHAANRDLAISTMYYNPYSDSNTKSTFGRSQLPVIGLSFLGNVSGKSAATGRSSKSSTYDVLIPLQSSRKSQSYLTSTSLGTVILPPTCEILNHSKSLTKPVPILNETNECGAVKVKLNLSSELSGNTKSSEPRTYFVVRPKFRCRKPAEPCIRVTFMKPMCIGCSEVILLPRTSKIADSDVMEEQWAFPVNIEVRETNLDEIAMLIENLQDDPLAQWRDDDDKAKFQQVEINVVRPECMLWDYTTSDWSSKTCSGGQLVENERLLCRCEQTHENVFEKLPLLLTGGLIILPNFINFEDYGDILGRLKNHPYVALSIAFWWIVFFQAFLWARRKDKQDLEKRHFHIPADSNPNDQYLYEVVVYTGMLSNAGTTANVTLSLEGDTGAVSDLHVINDANKTMLQRGSVDTFLITSNANLGKVKTVRVWHDNSGPAPSWYLNRVAVYDLRSSASPSLFLANLWLALDIVPFQCQVELHESSAENLASFQSLLKMSLFNQIRTTNVWFAPFNRVACSSFTRIQRVACIMVAVFSCMLASIMFFDTSGSSHYQLSAGYITFDFSALIAAAEAALLLAPVNIFVNFIFRNLQPFGLGDGIKANVDEELITPEIDIPKVVPRKMTITKKPYIVDKKDLKGQIIQFFEFPLPSSKPVKQSAWDKPVSKQYEIELDSEKVYTDLYKEILADLKDIREIALTVSGKSFDFSSEETSQFETFGFHDHKLEGAPYPIVGRNTKNNSIKQTLPDDISFDDLSVGQEDSQSNISEKTPSQFSADPRSSKCHLPRWCSVFAWVAVSLHFTTCSAFTLLYGLQYGNDKFQNWMLAFWLSIAQNMLVVTPLRIFSIAVLFACTRRGVVNLKDWQGFEGEGIRRDALLRWQRIQQAHQRHSQSYTVDPKSHKNGDSIYFACHPVPKRAAEMDKLPWCYVKPTFDRLEKAGRLKVAVLQVRHYWLGVLVWLVIIGISTSIIMLRRDWRVTHLDRHVENLFLQDFEDVKRGPDFLDFLERSLVPQLYGESEGPALPLDFQLLGPIRMRQVRLLPVTCHRKYNIPYKRRCKVPEDNVKFAWQYDSRHYKPYWQRSDQIPNHAQHLSTPWEYRNLEGVYETKLQSGNPLRRSYYPHGGYVIDLGYSNEDVVQSLRSLRNAVWVDAKTAAIFVQFSIQSPNLRCITSVTLVVELLAQGGVSLHKEMTTHQPVYLYSKLDLFVPFLQACHILVTVWLLIDLILQCKRVLWKGRGVVSILTDSWNWICYINVGLTFAAYAMFYRSLSTGMTVSANYKRDPGSYAPLSTPGYYTASYTLLLSLSTFFSHIILLKIFRGSQLVSVMMGTFKSARYELLSVTFVTGILVVAFMHSGVICFQQRVDFKTTLFSIMTLFSLMGGMDIEHPEVGVFGDLLWVIYFMLFTTLVLAMFVNLYAAVIDDAYHEMRQKILSREGYPVETLAVAWLYERVLSMFGIVSTKFNDSYENARVGTKKEMSQITFHSVLSQDRKHLSPSRALRNRK